MKRSEISSGIRESIVIKQAILEDEDMLQKLEDIIEICVAAYSEGGKILFCGNGGSAADAQHLAAELSGRYQMDRIALYAEALHVNTSYLTAVANDYTFEEVYARIVKGIAQERDVLFALSTSGKSLNVLNAIKEANLIGCTTIGLTGNRESIMESLCDFCLKIPSATTARVQECHMLLGHIICEHIEQRIFS